MVKISNLPKIATFDLPAITAYFVWTFDLPAITAYLNGTFDLPAITAYFVWTFFYVLETHLLRGLPIKKI